MTRRFAVGAICAILFCGVLPGQQKAKNVILFIGDAGGESTLNAASINGYGAPQKLFLQREMNVGLSDTSAANSWVTDSAAGMTAIVTGHKVNNGVLSQAPDGTPYKTILEYAEEHGLSTGVVSNMAMADATPAACYSHVDSRKKFGEIFPQIWKPRFGDGVDLVLGGGKKRILEALKESNIDLTQAAPPAGWPVYESLEEVPDTAKKAILLVDGDDFKVDEAAAKAIRSLSRNPKGYFLMVEWDLHPGKVEKMLETAVALDRLIEQTATKLASRDTLVLFAADHSFDVRLRSGKRGAPLLLPANAKDFANGGKFDLAVGTSHTGEEVLVAAHGPGAQLVKGFMPNTRIFEIMLAAWGWKK
ncbi:MAG: alkaline phosphatase [Bryobacterales bacterium]|nr:alkaline phosphatase [Bryobacterales bacterium]